MNAAEIAQTELELDNPNENENDEDVPQLAALLAACRAVAKTLTYEHCAAELDKIWGDHGRQVSGSLLVAACKGTERNYFRVEWAFWFARQSDAVREILLDMLARGKPKKKPEDELRDLKADFRSAFPKHADAIIRKAARP